MALTIRNVRPDDRDAWMALWKAYLQFYAVDLSDEISDFTWERLIGNASRLSARLAILDGAVVGFAIHHFHESTWATAPDCYLEDLFVDEAARGRRIGRALIDDLIMLCRENGWSRLYWHTNEDNHRARRLYDSYVKSDGHIRYRINL